MFDQNPFRNAKKVHEASSGILKKVSGLKKDGQKLSIQFKVRRYDKERTKGEIEFVDQKSLNRQVWILWVQNTRGKMVRSGTSFLNLDAVKKFIQDPDKDVTG